MFMTQVVLGACDSRSPSATCICSMKLCYKMTHVTMCFKSYQVTTVSEVCELIDFRRIED